MRKDLEAAFSRSSLSNDKCGLVHDLAKAEYNESTFLLFSSPSDAAALVLLNNMDHLSSALPQDNPPR